MKTDLRSTFWAVPAYLPYIQPDLTGETLAEAEDWIGFKIPKEYIELLQQQNGGYIRLTGLNGLNRILYGIGPYFPNLLDFNWADYKEYTTVALDGLIPFDGDGHWHICLDYRHDRDRPAVTFVDIESNREERIADSFAAYLDQVKLPTEDRYVLETGRSLEDMAAQLQTILEIEWAEPDTRAHGYPVYRAKWKDRWIWLSPNEVPKGYIRAWEDRYEELKDRMEGLALRYPELPASCLLVQVCDGEQGGELQTVLAGYGIALKCLQDVV